MSLAVLPMGSATKILDLLHELVVVEVIHEPDSGIGDLGYV